MSQRIITRFCVICVSKIPKQFYWRNIPSTQLTVQTNHRTLEIQTSKYRFKIWN